MGNGDLLTGFSADRPMEDLEPAPAARASRGNVQQQHAGGEVVGKVRRRIPHEGENNEEDAFDSGNEDPKHVLDSLA